VGGFTAATKVAAVLKDSVVASRFGNGGELDAFLLALAVPAFLVNVIAGTLPAALTPSFVVLREREGPMAARMLAVAVLQRMYRVLVLLSVAAALLSLCYIWLPGAQMSDSTRALLRWLALLLAPYTLLQGVCAVWSGLLAAEGRFAVAAVAPVAQPLCITALLLCSDTPHVSVLAVGLLLGTLVQGAALAVALRRRGMFPWPRFSAVAEQAGTRDAMRTVRGQYLPAMAGALLMSATTIVDQSMAVWLPPGSVAALNFGTKLSALLMSVGAVALSTTLLPYLSQLVAREEWEALRRVTKRVTVIILGITIPLTLLLIALSTPIVRVMYERGAFAANETSLVAQVQSAYLLQVPVHLLGILYVRLISALSVNRLLTISAAVSLLVNIALNVLFMRWFGVAGIALSTAGVYLVSCVFLGGTAHRALSRAEATTRQRRADHGQTRALTGDEPCASAA